MVPLRPFAPPQRPATLARLPLRRRQPPRATI